MLFMEGLGRLRASATAALARKYYRHDGADHVAQDTIADYNAEQGCSIRMVD